MSLISLSSDDKNHLSSQQPFNFKNNFSQPLIIKPNSQVALVNFYHFRNDGFYNINLTNNKIVYNFGNAVTGGRYNAFLRINEYSGAELATEIARALNEGNIAFQNYLFACAFTQGNPNANPVTFDTFEVTFTSVATPTTRGGLLNLLFNDGSALITANDAVNQNSALRKNALIPNYAVCQIEEGIHNHEGTWQVEDFHSMNGTFNDFLVAQGVNNIYEYNFGENAHIAGLYAEDLCSLNNPDPRFSFRSDKASILVHFRRSTIRVRTLDRRTNGMINKKRLQVTLNGVLHTALANFVFNNVDRWKELSYRIQFFKDAASNVAIQLQVSGDGGLTYVIPTEADNTGGTFGVNADGCPNIYQAQTINGNNVNGIFYMSKQNGNPLAVGGFLNTADKSNVLAKANGKYRCIVSMSNNFVPFPDGSAATLLSNFDLRNKTFDVDYGAGGSKFDMAFTAHALDNGFDFDIATSNQAGVPVANQLLAADLNNLAVVRNLLKNRLGLVWDIRADRANPASVVVGELHFDRRAVNNSARGNISLRAFANGLAGKTVKFDIAVPTAPISAVSKNQTDIFMSGIYNQANKQKQIQLGVGGEPHHHTGDFASYEDLTDIPQNLLGAALSSRLVLLVDRITQNDIDTIAGVGGVPFQLTINTPSGNIGKLLGFSNNVLSMAGNATNQPAGAGNPFLSDQQTLIISKDTTLHISIPELAGVKSFEGESSQQYKTIKIIPKSDFQQGQNGSLSFTSNYQDFIDINNAQELQLNELTVQVRQPDGVMATALQPVTRATIKIQQNPQTAELNKMEKLMDRMERVMSQNQQKVNDISNPEKVYT